MSIVVQLNGTVRSADAVTYLWEKVSGPGTAVFSDAAAIDPTVTLGAAGTYVLKLTATDVGGLSASDTVTITASVNTAPTVNAGEDFNALAGKLYALNGSVDDADGFPVAGTLTSTWSKVSGSGTVSFTNANDSKTTVSFSAADTYVLRLTGDDGALTATDDVSVTVVSQPGTMYASAVAAAASGPLTDVLYMVDLSRLSNDWHAATSANGVNIRVTDHNNNMLPHYVVNYSADADTGCLFYKRNASASNDAVRIWTGGSQTAAEPVDGTYGQYNTFRPGIAAFYPTGGGNDATHHLRHLVVVGSPTAAAGPIGLAATTYSPADVPQEYAKKYLGATPFNYPLSLSCVTNKSDNAANNYMGLVSLGNSNANTTLSELNSLSLFMFGDGEQGVARCVSGTSTYAGSFKAPSAGTWRNFAATFTSDTRRDIYAGTETGLDVNNCVVRNQDFLTVGAWPCGVWVGSGDKTLCLVGLYTEILSANMTAYMQLMLDQSTMFSSWADTTP